MSDAVHASRVGGIVTAGMDSHLCIWAERSPHGLSSRLRAACPQLCLATEPLQPLLYSGGTDGNLNIWHLPGKDGREAAPTCVRGPHRGSWVTRLLRLEERKLLFSAGNDCKVVEWAIRIDYDSKLTLEMRRELCHHGT